MRFNRQEADKQIPWKHRYGGQKRFCHYRRHNRNHSFRICRFCSPQIPDNRKIFTVAGHQGRQHSPAISGWNDLRGRGIPVCRPRNLKSFSNRMMANSAMTWPFTPRTSVRYPEKP